MKHLRRLAAVLLGVPMLAAAQTPIIEPSVAIGCLQPAGEARGRPDYPFEEWKLGRGGQVEAELSFSSAHQAPEFKLLRSEGGEAFVEAVRAHVQAFRMPCVDRGLAPARLQFVFTFKPDDRQVAMAHPKDPDVEALQQQFACLTHTSGRRGPSYPRAALRAGTQGGLWAEVLFDAPDQPPSFKVYSATGSGPLHRAVEDWMPGYRLPCFTGPALRRMTLQYLFRLGDDVQGFKPMGLRQFLGLVKGIEKQRLDFDFNQMACPFDVRLHYLQPHRRNVAYQLVSHDPSREPFVEWLRTVELDLTREAHAAAYGDHLSLTIPCLRINLNPQE